MRRRGHYHERKPNVWTVSVSLPQEKGLPRRSLHRTAYGAERDADRLLVQLLAEVQAGKHSEDRGSLSAYLEGWLRQVRRHHKPNTARSYAGSVRKAAAALGSRKLASLKRRDWQAFFDGLMDAGAAPASVHLHHAVLHAAMQQAVSEERLRGNPLAGIRLPRQEQEGPAVLTPAETRMLLAAARGDLSYLPTLLAAGAGLRVGEILALEWRDLRGNVLTVRRSRDPKGAVGTPKAGKAGDIILPAFLLAELRAHRQEQENRRAELGRQWSDLGLIVENGVGLPLSRSTLRTRFHHALRRAGLPRIRFHALRHGCGSHLLDAGVPVPVVARQLRHSPQVLVQVYAHVIAGREAAAAAAMDALLGSPEAGSFESPLDSSDPAS